MIRRWLHRFGVWLVERTAPPPLPMPPIADWERPYLDQQARDLNRILF